jgi:hypothetical protein
LQVPVHGGDAKSLIEVPFDEVQDVAVSPDGRSLVAAVGEFRSDVWIAEDFDSEVAGRD